MRLNALGLAAVALAGLGWIGGAARASHCGACCYPATAVCPDQCAPPVVSYRVCYRAVWEEQTKICYRPCYRTEYKQVCETVMRPHYEQHCREESYPVSRPVVECYQVPQRYC